MEQKEDFEKELLRLLNQYHHYFYMNNGFWKSLRYGWTQGMNLGEFMLWLESRRKN